MLKNGANRVVVAEGGLLGRFKIKNKLILAHRFSYELFVSKIPDDKLILHKCDVRNCVNPDHFFIGTKKDNTKDMFLKGRENKRNGSNNGNSKLKAVQVTEIRNLYGSNNYSQQSLATMFNVSQVLISKIIRNKLWPK